MNLFDSIEDEFNEFFVFIYNSLDSFRSLFYNVERRIKYIDFEILAFNAIEEYQKIDASNESILLKWLVVNEELYNAVRELTSSIDSEGKLKINHSKLLIEQKFIEGNYKIMTQFEAVYKEHYWSMITKYQVHDDEVPEKMTSDSEEFKKYFSLKYQLKKRGIQV